MINFIVYGNKNSVGTLITRVIARAKYLRKLGYNVTGTQYVINSKGRGFVLIHCK